MFWDHNVKWCIRVVGAAEIDFWFSVLQPHVSFRHFTEGISSLKQVTGCEHCDVQHYIVGVVAGAIPRDFLIMIQVVMHIQYLCQAEEIDNECCHRIQAALDEFHAHKSAIVGADACIGKGNRPIYNWYIPKLTMMQSVVPNIWANGAVIQFSADVTEHAHIMEIKNPAQAGNNQCYEAQIYCDLYHTDKLCHFKLATMTHDPHLRLNYSDLGDVNSYPSTVTQLLEGSCQSHNYFDKASHLQDDDWALHPLHTFTNSHVAFHVNCHLSFRQMTINDAAEKFGLADLHPALTDFVCHYVPNNLVNYVIGGWWSGWPILTSISQKLKSGLVCMCKQSHSTVKTKSCLPSMSVHAHPVTIGHWGAMIMWLSILTIQSIGHGVVLMVCQNLLHLLSTTISTYFK